LPVESSLIPIYIRRLYGDFMRHSTVIIKKNIYRLQLGTAWRFRVASLFGRFTTTLTHCGWLGLLSAIKEDSGPFSGRTRTSLLLQQRMQVCTRRILTCLHGHRGKGQNNSLDIKNWVNLVLITGFL